MKKRPSANGLLYVILDKNVIEEANRDIFSLTDKLAYYGVDIFQLRANDIRDRLLLQLAVNLTKIIHKRKKIFIINNRADIAYLSKADGLHVGENDISPNEARKILGNKVIIGKTVHSFRELECFQKEKINYVSIGPVFKTKTKPALNALISEELKMMLMKTNKLTFAIGGINLYNMEPLLNNGIRNIAVCRGVILSRNLKTNINKYKKCLKKVL